MAREILAYACEFRCGERVKTSRATILRHEQQCFKNPKNKACPACKHNKKGWYDDCSGRAYFACGIEKKPEENVKFVKKCKFFEQSKEKTDGE